MELSVKRILIVTIGGLLFFIVMEKSGIYAKIEKMI